MNDEGGGADAGAGWRDVVRDIAPWRLAAATAIVAVGLFPLPQFILLRDPRLASDPVVLNLRAQMMYYVGAILLIVAPALVIGYLLRDRLRERFDRWRTALGGAEPNRLAMVVAAGATIAAVWMAFYGFSRSPTSSDEIAQLWHGKMLLAGRLFLPADPNPEFFAIDNVIDRGRWYSQFPIGGPAIAALGLASHVGWIVNPLCVGCIVYNVYRFSRIAHDRSTALLAALLLAVSPVLAMMGGSFMNHAPVLMFLTTALAALAVWTERPAAHRGKHAAVVGVAIGAAIAVRPLDGVIASAVFGAFMVITALRERTRWPSIAVGAAAGAVPLSLLLFANWRTTGDALRFGYEVMWGANHTLGFHADPTGNLHTPARALMLATSYLVQLNWSMLGWPIPTLLLVVVGLLSIRARNRWDALVLCWFAVHLVAYALYWHAGQFVGPRYLFSVIPFVAIAAAQGVRWIDRAARPELRSLPWVAVAASIAAAWCIHTPPFGAIGGATALHRTRRSLKIDVAPALSTLGTTRALVFAPEQASFRLSRRLSALALPRTESARLLATRDGCALLEAVRVEEQRADAPAARLARLEKVDRYAPTRYRLMVADAGFRVSDSASITPACMTELAADAGRTSPVAFGALMWRNTINASGRIDGQVIFVADLGDHNEVLRERFSDRTWFRLEMRIGADSVPRPELVPYR